MNKIIRAIEIILVAIITDYIFLTEDDWKEKVWDKKIFPDRESLYKQPGYSCD